MTLDARGQRIIRLILQAETIDALITREGRPPIEQERSLYERVVLSLRREREYKVLPHYERRLASIYRPVTDRSITERECSD